MIRVLKDIMLISCYTLQLILFGLCFLVFTSTIKLFPWYEPLTMGAFLGLILFTPIQFSISLLMWIFNKNILIYNGSNTISFINSGILLFTICITMIKESLFYPLAIAFAISECLLAIIFVITIIMSLIRLRKCS